MNFIRLEKYETFDEKLKERVPNFQSKAYDAKHEITDAMREDIKSWLDEMKKRKIPKDFPLKIKSIFTILSRLASDRS